MVPGVAGGLRAADAIRSWIHRLVTGQGIHAGGGAGPSAAHDPFELLDGRGRRWAWTGSVGPRWTRSSRRRDAAGRFRAWRAGSWSALVEYLRLVGVLVADRPRLVADAVDAVLAGFAGYEITERGLSARTVDRNVRAVRPFVQSRMRDGRVELDSLTAGEVTAFVVDQSAAIGGRRSGW